jgi:hypothetical protein
MVWACVGQADAASGDPVQIQVDGGALSFDRMAPGIGRSHELTVIAERSSVEVRFGVQDLVSSDNGCLEPEIRAGDSTCDEGGELTPWLRARVERVTDGADDVPLYEGLLADLDLRLAVGSRSPVRLRISVVPDVSMGNDTMSDSVTFALRWSADDRVGTVPAGGSADIGVAAHELSAEPLDGGILVVWWSALVLGVAVTAVVRLAARPVAGRHRGVTRPCGVMSQNNIDM